MSNDTTWRLGGDQENRAQEFARNQGQGSERMATWPCCAARPPRQSASKQDDWGTPVAYELAMACGVRSSCDERTTRNKGVSASRCTPTPRHVTTTSFHWGTLQETSRKNRGFKVHSQGIRSMGAQQCNSSGKATKIRTRRGRKGKKAIKKNTRMSSGHVIEDTAMEIMHSSLGIGTCVPRAHQ